jgi:hypothetical protein
MEAAIRKLVAKLASKYRRLTFCTGRRAIGPKRPGGAFATAVNGVNNQRNRDKKRIYALIRVAVHDLLQEMRILAGPKFSRRPNPNAEGSSVALIIVLEGGHQSVLQYKQGLSYRLNWPQVTPRKP